MAESGVRDILRQSLPLLLMMATIEVLAGSLLGRMEASLEALPGLLALVPAVLAMRGNISTSMGSRLGTQARFGLLPHDRWFAPIIWHSVAASLILGIILSTAAAVISHYVSRGLGLEAAGIPVLAAIAISAGLVSGIIMGFVAIVTMRVAFRRGLDLDNVAGPVLMTMSDLFTLLSLFAAARIFGGLA